MLKGTKMCNGVEENPEGCKAKIRSRAQLGFADYTKLINKRQKIKNSKY